MKGEWCCAWLGISAKLQDGTGRCPRPDGLRVTPSGDHREKNSQEVRLTMDRNIALPKNEATIYDPPIVTKADIEIFREGFLHDNHLPAGYTWEDVVRKVKMCLPEIWQLRIQEDLLEGITTHASRKTTTR